ncbi:hypothetical protein CAZ10_09560 [Pseudomonas aeruginosa]|uniref:Uncharacterized protein n=1 Tax=Pseudomonas aeruginosa TaxID=287 RepID=A0A241XSE6_PSEAI|nr:hypothetical protein A9513_015610 [Pseudomonas sp. AU12215]OTI63076.1 hypothetical protein CAZ10_09560 [Pseudomonas aeruginosa]
MAWKPDFLAAFLKWIPIRSLPQKGQSHRVTDMLRLPVSVGRCQLGGKNRCRITSPGRQRASCRLKSLVNCGFQLLLHAVSAIHAVLQHRQDCIQLLLIEFMATMDDSHTVPSDQFIQSVCFWNP